MKIKSSLIMLLASGFVLASCGGPATPTSSAGGSSASASAGSDSTVVPSESSPAESESTPEPLKIASGAKQFVNASYEDRTEILGKLEKYVVDTGLTGLPLFENGGYNIVSSRVVKGTETYIPNYGFSTFRDGRPNGNLSGETNQAIMNYYHTWDSSDPQTINALNNQGSQVSDLHADIQSGYFGTRLNKAKTGYEWYGVLSAKDRPYAVQEDGTAKEADATELHSKWRVYVRTGEKGGVAYRTNSQNAERKAYDNTYAKLEDYVAAFQILLTGKNNYFRGAELAKQTGSSGIVGASDFFSGTKAGFDENLWKRVGIQSGTDTTGDYLDFTFMVPTNRFYAMYNVASSLYCPIPMSFFKLVTDNGANPGNYGSYNSDKTFTPVDNILSVGPVFLESWTPEQSIQMKANANWWEKKENADLYRWDGIHYNILTGYSSDKTIAFKEYQAGKLDSVGIPTQYLKEYKSNPLAAKVPGSSTFKLNLNTCDEATWESLFGKAGSVYKHDNETDYWNVKPWMSNDSFVRGMFYAIDRQNFADARGSIPSINYFSDAYLSNPEDGISYNSTAAHAAALENFWGDTVETYGYSEALAIEAFKTAITELEAAGDLEGVEELGIELVWMYTDDIREYGDEIVSYIEGAFNKAAEALDKDVTLKINQTVGDATTYMGVYYKMMHGEFDIGFGSISGNSLNPINFLEVLKSDNSSTFTLNWGKDTSLVDLSENALVYDDEVYSFDGLWAAADTGVILDENGEIVDASDFVLDAEKSYLDSTKKEPELHLEGTFQPFDDPALELVPYDFFAQSGYAEDYIEAYADGYEDYNGAGTTADPFQFDPKTGKFSVTFYGALVTNIEKFAEAQKTGDKEKGLIIPTRIGLDCYKYIDGVYLGVDSPTHTLSDVIKWVPGEDETGPLDSEDSSLAFNLPKGLNFVR